MSLAKFSPRKNQNHRSADAVIHKMGCTRRSRMSLLARLLYRGLQLMCVGAAAL